MFAQPPQRQQRVPEFAGQPLSSLSPPSASASLSQAGSNFEFQNNTGATFDDNLDVQNNSGMKVAQNSPAWIRLFSSKLHLAVTNDRDVSAPIVHHLRAPAVAPCLGNL